MIKSAAEAEKLSHGSIPDRLRSDAFFDGMKSLEVMALVKALESLERDGSPCPSCEGEGRMWADGKAHYATYGGETIACGGCGGSGQIRENVYEIAQKALNQYRTAIKGRQGE